jgi:hypothetical protein
MSTNEITDIILDYLKEYNPQFIGLFGSYARSEQTNKSDIDILVAFHNGISLLKLIRLENELSLRLGIKVDLITEGSLINEKIRDNISKDLQIIYQA